MLFSILLFATFFPHFSNLKPIRDKVTTVERQVTQNGPFAYVKYLFWDWGYKRPLIDTRRLDDMKFIRLRDSSIVFFDERSKCHREVKFDVYIERRAVEDVDFLETLLHIDNGRQVGPNRKKLTSPPKSYYVAPPPTTPLTFP